MDHTASVPIIDPVRKKRPLSPLLPEINVSVCLRWMNRNSDSCPYEMRREHRPPSRGAGFRPDTDARILDPLRNNTGNIF